VEGTETTGVNEVSLVHLKIMHVVKPYDKVARGELIRYYKQVPTTYCWMQTYVTYSYYEHSKYLLYKNMGLILSRVRGDGKPRPYNNYKIRMFK